MRNSSLSPREPDPCPSTNSAPDLFRHAGACNAYALRDEDAALLIDLGDGSILDELAAIGVRRVEWVLFTHHHREQCQGAHRLAAERALFESPLSFRKWSPRLGDAFTVHGASYVRPPAAPVRVTRSIARMDTFAWRGREVVCVQTPGNSPGHTAYLLRDAVGRWVGFSSDMMLDGGKFHTWYDSEWDYGFAKGLYELGNSAAQLAGYDPDVLYPAHGPVIRDCRRQLDGYVARLRHLAGLCLRGYDLFRFAGADQDRVSTPTAVPFLWRLTPRLYKFRGPDYWVNFAMLLADDGHALVIDCGTTSAGRSGTG